MKLEWLGENREIIGALYRAANAFSQICKKEVCGDTVTFSSYEIQIMEHIMEFENQNMKWYAIRLGLSPSMYTKIVQKMVKKGLVEKYHVKGNKKDIILRVSKLGMEEYNKYLETAKNGFFKELFKKLDSYSDQSKADIQEFLTIWGECCFKYVDYEEERNLELVKVN